MQHAVAYSCSIHYSTAISKTLPQHRRRSLPPGNAKGQSNLLTPCLPPPSNLLGTSHDNTVTKLKIISHFSLDWRLSILPTTLQTFPTFGSTETTTSYSTIGLLYATSSLTTNRTTVRPIGMTTRKQNLPSAVVTLPGAPDGPQSPTY